MGCTTDDIDAIVATSPLLQGRVSPRASCAAVIVAGGSGSRFGNPGGKQLLDLFGRPMLTWSVMAFDAVADIGEIIVVCPEDKIDEYCRVAFDPYPLVTAIRFAPAGDLRQSSSCSGILEVDERYEYIAVHDGARPLIMPDLIEHTVNVLKGTYDADGAIVGHPAIDTLKVVGNGAVVGTPDRSMFWNAQTPQVFRAPVLRRAHLDALANGYIGTDDSSLVERIGGRVLLVDGPRDNLKVTVPEDQVPVEAALMVRLMKMGI